MTEHPDHLRSLGISMLVLILNHSSNLTIVINKPSSNRDLLGSSNSKDRVQCSNNDPLIHNLNNGNIQSSNRDHLTRSRKGLKEDLSSNQRDLLMNSHKDLSSNNLNKDSNPNNCNLRKVHFLNNYNLNANKDLNLQLSSHKLLAPTILTMHKTATLVSKI